MEKEESCVAMLVRMPTRKLIFSKKAGIMDGIPEKAFLASMRTVVK